MIKAINEIRYYRFIVSGVRVELTPEYNMEGTFLGWFIELSLVNLPHIIGSPKLPPEYKVTSNGGGENGGGGSTITKIEDTEVPRWVGKFIGNGKNNLDEWRILKRFNVGLNKNSRIIQISLEMKHKELKIEVTECL